MENSLARLPQYELNDDGAMKEWLYPGLKDNYHHRHLSHLYGLFPGEKLRLCGPGVVHRL